ncbi:MAG: hypothetical protein LBE86_01455 [Gemmobacter sp.]|nr:hypothetical protein [Gemmobacter sp.]
MTPRESLFPGPQLLAEGEVVEASFHPDRAAYLRATLILAVVFGTGAGLVLLAMGNPHPWAGPVAAILAIGARAAYLASEALAAEWRLTDRRLLGPGGQTIPRGQISQARRVFGDVMVITRAGDKHLIKYQADAAAVIAALEGGRR